MRTLVLFTRDLRVHDHPALTEAVRSSDEVVPLFVLDPALLRISPNRSRFLIEGLHDLHGSLRERGGRLVLRHGDVATTAVAVARVQGVDRVVVTADVSANARRRERRLGEGLATDGIELRVLPGHAIVEPGELAPAGRDAYVVFTPYHRVWAAAPRRSVLSAPTSVPVPADIVSDPLPDPRSIGAEALDLPTGGERAGRRRLEKFLRTGARTYDGIRNDPAADVTSRLSPYLRFGFVSATEVAQRAARVQGSGGFVRQLAWRDFFGQLLWHDPRLAWQDLREAPALQPPSLDPELALKLWKEGMTGLPLVDAGMRQLRREGWIHNRVRMVVASFLTRRLGVPWQEGAEHFTRWLVDGDPANNAGGWQWVAGTGTDPRRSRSFNPVRQARRFDPNGDYVRRYVRELRGVEGPLVSAPWRDATLLQSRGYPEPVCPVPDR
ncbi:MAG TPA: deoxyribodipyrimidine photo-lyase [Actinomycetota bacterium]|nr:deoxyribodipyrimidine photo-lyase [Actinomycetota bacterium]